VWDSNTQQPICTFKGYLTKGVIALGFSVNGDKLAAIGLDDTHQISIFDITAKSKKGGVVLMQDKVGPDVVTDIKWRNDSDFVTVGVNHFRYWTTKSGSLTYKRGVFNKGGSSKFLVAAFLNDDCLVGAADGTLQIFKMN
jgi:WD40 repeat protein